MTHASRRADFFAVEANEYLVELDPLVAVHDRPDAERLVRGARALRGAALMAGLGTYARAAAGLETIAKQVRDHALGWEPAARTAWIDGIATLRALVARAASWEAADDRQALLLAERLDEVITGRPARSAPARAELTPGVRAFIARESALIAGSLEQASRALAPIPPAAALAGVLERMQSLRGLGASAELSPLPELLDAMEIVTRTLLADVPAPPNVATVFADAAHVMSAMARAVADAGQIAQSPELESIAKRLLESYASESDVIAVAALAPDGVDSIVRMGTPPSELPDSDPIPVELVSVGDHLLLVADQLSRPATAAARDLRLFVLHRTLAAMPARSATGRFLAPLTEAITAAIAYQVAAERPDAFVAMLRGCGHFLVDAGGMTDRQALTRRRDAITTSLTMIGMGAPAGPPDAKMPPAIAAAPPPVAVSEPESTPPATLAATPDYAASIEPDLVATDDPRDSLDAAFPAPPSAASAEPAAPALTISWATEPLESIPPAAPSLVEILTTHAPAPTLETIVSIDSLAPDEPVVSIDALAPDEPVVETVDIAALAFDAPPEIPAPVIPEYAAGEPSRLEVAFGRRQQVAADTIAGPASLDGFIAAEIVPVASLLYRGEAALNRAADLRGELVALLDAPELSVTQLRPHVDELLDLILLVRDPA
ncbi:MAG TPA: hypothetical protein VGM77_12640 [Gemmatimonadales bacterium]|jgi:hypothetical protein